jgi:hypothetical protein
LDVGAGGPNQWTNSTPASLVVGAVGRTRYASTGGAPETLGKVTSSTVTSPSRWLPTIVTVANVEGDTSPANKRARSRDADAVSWAARGTATRIAVRTTSAD